MEHPTSTDSPAPSTSARTESFTTTEHAETPELPHDGQMEASYMDTKRMKLEGSESPKSDSNEPIVVVDDEELPPRSQETPSSIAQPLSQQSLANPEAQQLESLPAGYVDVTLERRKLEMLESFQVTSLCRASFLKAQYLDCTSSNRSAHNGRRRDSTAFLHSRAGVSPEVLSLSGHETIRTKQTGPTMSRKPSCERPNRISVSFSNGNIHKPMAFNVCNCIPTLP